MTNHSFWGKQHKVHQRERTENILENRDFACRLLNILMRLGLNRFHSETHRQKLVSLCLLMITFESSLGLFLSSKSRLNGVIFKDKGGKRPSTYSPWCVLSILLFVPDFFYNSNKVSCCGVCSESRVRLHRAAEVSIIRLPAYKHICFHLTSLLAPLCEDHLRLVETLNYAKACNVRGGFGYTGGGSALWSLTPQKNLKFSSFKHLSQQFWVTMKLLQTVSLKVLSFIT